MQKHILAFLITCSFLGAKAQLLNASFELTDTPGNITGWNLLQGKMSKLSVINFGALPFTAADGNYFIRLESDTLVSPVKRALFEQRCAFTDTPGSVYMNYLYIPENTLQHAEIVLLLTKWNGAHRDTILYRSDTIPVVANGSNIPIQWNTWLATLAGNYRMAALPDSAWIRLSNADNNTSGRNIRLFADNITFGRWAAGLAEQNDFPVSIYPNPVSDLLIITANGHKPIDRFLLTDITGKQFAVTGYTVANGQYTIDVNMLPGGLYVLTMIRDDYPLHRKMVLIKH